MSASQNDDCIIANAILDELKDRYGCQFERMSRTLKLYLLISVASILDSDLQQLGNELTNPATTEIINRLQSELALKDLEKLLITLAHQVHNQKKSLAG